MDKVVVGWDYKSQKLEDRKSKITRCFKVCRRCGVIKPIYQFSTDKRNTNGKTSVCKKCQIIRYLEYYYQNRNKIMVVHKKYRDDNKGVRTKYFENYKRMHKEHLKVVSQKWYKRNRGRLKKERLKLKVSLK